jgi:hypothetical protein
MNAINVQLYTKGQFKRNGRKFSPASALLKTSGTKSLAPHSRGVRLKHKFRLN